MRALIAGSTGEVGSHLLKKMTEDSRVTKVLALSRRPLPESSPKLKTWIMDQLIDLCQLENLPEKFKGPWDVAICCLGTTLKKAGSREAFKKVDLDGCKIIIDLALKLQIPHFQLVSAAGANRASKIFYSQIKGEVENYLLSKSFETIDIFRPGLLLTDRKEFRLGELMAIKTILALKYFSPSSSLINAWTTDINVLAQVMLEKSLSPKKGKRIFESIQINSQISNAVI